ncbi:MAG: hypothetical protein JWR63_1884 [Conexibacter sp.]|nr:hypothetical protein [Conexibacter sp.]
MAEERMMTAGDVVANAMAGEHGDLLCDAVALVVRELMEAEVAQVTGAGRGERSESDCIGTATRRLDLRGPGPPQHPHHHRHVRAPVALRRRRPADGASTSPPPRPWKRPT